MLYHYKQIAYEQLDKRTRIKKGKVILNKGEWDMVKDYILLLEGKLRRANGSTFGSIEEELVKCLGEEKVNKYYKREV